ncbi:MAG: hypothetical protein Q8R28_19235 [Dehalococcoidia bacterium]|nr:hypothetical protein [Dehalococcoidia bacterium]
MPAVCWFAPDMWFHQLFNVGLEPARHLALRYNGQKQRLGGNLGITGATENVKTGGNQIEYEDEDPEIRRIFESELAKRGVESKMAPFFGGK